MGLGAEAVERGWRREVEMSRDWEDICRLSSAGEGAQGRWVAGAGKGKQEVASRK